MQKIQHFGIFFMFFVLVWHQQLYGQLKPEQILTGHNHGIAKLQFSADGKQLFSAGDRNGSIRIWNIRNGTQTDFLPVGSQYIWAASLSPDMRYAVGSSQDERTVMFNLERNSVIKVIPKSYRYLSYTPDGNFLVTDAGEVINSATGKMMSNTLGYLDKFAISADSKFVIDAGPKAVSIQSLLDAKVKPVMIHYPKDLFLPPYTGGVAVNSFMTKVAVGYYASEGITMISVVDIPNKKILATFETPLSSISDISFSPDGNYYAICGNVNESSGSSGVKVIM